MVWKVYYRDRYNTKKIWEVVKLSGGYYLRQYVSGRQIGKGLRTTKKFISDIGIFGFEEVKDFVKAGRTGRRR